MQNSQVTKKAIVLDRFVTGSMAIMCYDAIATATTFDNNDNDDCDDDNDGDVDDDGDDDDGGDDGETYFVDEEIT